MFKMTRIHVFQCEVADKPGGTAAKLKSLADSGAHLEYVYSERSANKPGVGELFVAPRQQKSELDLVKNAGFHEVQEPIVMRFEGDDKTGLGSRVTAAWETAGINLHGLMMAVLNGKFVGYATFDTANDANHAATILAEIGTQS
jgi:hypothetical protein